MTPGSDEAIAQGCTCPVLDNGRGRGAYQVDNQWAYWIAFGCPLHHDTKPTEEDTDDGMDH
jgi:hypothetical protein